MPQATLSTLTYEEFLEQTPEDAPVEWVDGEAVPLSAVDSQHEDIAEFILTCLAMYNDKHNSGVVLRRPFRMKTGPRLPCRIPDLIFVASEHRSRFNGMRLDGPADLAVEVSSMESRVRDGAVVFYEYEQGGVREYWRVDATRRQAEFYTLGDNGVYHGHDVEAGDAYQSTVLPGLWLRPKWLWEPTSTSLFQALSEWELI